MSKKNKRTSVLSPYPTTIRLHEPDVVEHWFAFDFKRVPLVDAKLLHFSRELQYLAILQEVASSQLLHERAVSDLSLPFWDVRFTKIGMGWKTSLTFTAGDKSAMRSSGSNHAGTRFPLLFFTHTCMAARKPQGRRRRYIRLR